MLWNVDDGRFLADELTLVPPQISPVTMKTWNGQVLSVWLGQGWKCMLCARRSGEKPAATVVKLKTYSLLHVVEKKISRALMWSHAVYVCSYCTSVCTICKCNTVAFAPTHTSCFACICIHEWWMLLWNKVYKHTLSCVQTACSKSRCVLHHWGFCLVVFFFFLGWGEAMDVSISVPHSQASSLAGKDFWYTTLLMFPHHSCGQLHAEDIYWLCFMMEILSNMFLICFLKYGLKITGHKQMVNICHLMWFIQQ